MVPQLKRKKLWYLPDGTVTETYQPGARSSPLTEPVGVFNPERFIQEQEALRQERLTGQIKPTLPDVSPITEREATLPQPTTPVVKETATPEPLGFDKALRKLYPQSFAEGSRLGEDPLKTTDILLKTIQQDLKTNPDIFLNDLKTKYKQTPDETKALLRFFVPDITDEQIEQELNPLTDNRVVAALGKIPGFADYSLDDVLKEAETNPDKFLTTILEGGVTTAERDLLRAMGVDETTITQILRTPFAGGTAIDRGQLAIQAEIREREKRVAEGKQGKFGRLFTAGVGDLVANTGGVFRWLGAEGIGNKISQAGEFMQVQAMPLEPPKEGEFKWQDLFNPSSDTFQSSISGIIRATPTAMMFFIPGIGAYGLAGKAAGAIPKLGGFARAIITGIGGSAIVSPIEGAMEAAQSYDEARARGLSHEEANKKAEGVFKKNLATLGISNMAELALAFSPIKLKAGNSLIKAGLVTTAKVGGKVIISGLTEGGEEILQDIFQRQARGEKFKMDDEAKLVFTIGATMGMGMGGAGDVMVRIADKVMPSLNPQQTAKFNTEVKNNLAKGLDEKQAKVQAMDKVVESNPDIAKVVETATEEVNQEITQEAAAKVAGEVVTPAVPQPAAERITAPQGEAVTPAPEVIPIMITRDMEARLKAIGISQVEIDKMTPKQAWDRLKVTPAPEVKPVTQVPGEPEAGIKPPEIPPAKVTPAETKQADFTNKYVASKGQKAPPPTEPPVTTTKMPDDMPASQQVANRISFDPEKESLASRFLRGKNKAMTQWIDKLYPIDTLVSEAKKLGADIAFEENPYMLARLLEGNVSKATTFLEDGTFGRTFWKMENGKATPNFKGKSLTSILDNVKEPEQWRDFSTYLTAQRAKELSKFGIESGITDDIATKAIAELEAKYSNFARLSDDIQKYQSDLLDYVQESGLISVDLRKALDNKYASYVPFYRVLEELQGTGYMGKRMVNIATPIKRIKGSELEIINPLESIVKNTYAFINAADRNQVGVAMARLVNDIPELAGLLEPIRTPIAKVATVTAKELGIESAGFSDEAIEGVFNIFRPSMFTDDNVVTILIDGKKKFFKVDPDLKVALKAMDTTNMGLLWKILSSPAKWLRAGATLSPDFMIRNPLRDAGTAFVYSNYGFIPGVDFLRGVGHLVGKTSTYKLFKMSGGEHSMLVSLDREYLTKSFKEIVEGKGFTDYVKHPLGLLQIVSELGEKATRLGEFAKGIKSGALPLPAGMSAREVTLDFAKAGTHAKAVNQIIAFFNANIRGWDRMVTAFKDHPTRTSFKVMAGITLPSIALWTINHDDDRWKEIPQWQKDLFWIVMTEDNIYRIPKPFELGVIFGSGPERLLDYLNDKDPKMGKKLLENFLGAGLPSFIPTGALPIIENITNYSFFRDRAIVPESKQDLPPELQYTEWTSELAKGMGKLLNQSPMKIDNILFGWTGGLGRYATDIIDKSLEKTGIVPAKIEPSPTLADLPVAKAFIVRNPLGSSSESVNTFYEEMAAITAIEKLLKSHLDGKKQKEFDKLKAAHPEVLFQYDAEKDESYSATARYLRRVSGELADIRKLQDKVYKATNMTPEKKRELITQLDGLITDVATRALELIKNPSNEVSLLQTPVAEIEAKLGSTSNSPLAGDNITLKALAGDLVKASGDSPLKKLMERKNTVLADISNLPDIALYKIDRLTYKGGLTKRQNELLNGYEAAVDKKAFLNENPELKINPKLEWLTNHPEDNAILALTGNAKLYTQKAYDIAMKMVEDNDIPSNAFEAKVLPPKGLAKPYFEFRDILKERDEASWEAKLHLAKNDKLREFLDLKLSDTPIASLELKVKNADNLRLLDSSYPDSFGDKDGLNYKDDKVKDKDGLTERDRAIAQLYKDNPSLKDDRRKIQAIEIGTNEKPTPDDVIKSHVDYMKLGDTATTDNADFERQTLSLIDLSDPENPKLTDYAQWRLDNKLMTEAPEFSRIKEWQLDVQYEKEDKDYKAITEKHKGITYANDTLRDNAIRADQRKFQEDNIEWRLDEFRRDAYIKKNKDTGFKLPEDEVEDYAAYKDLLWQQEGLSDDKPFYGEDRFLLENDSFRQAMFALTGADKYKNPPAFVPPIEYDELGKKHNDTYALMERWTDETSSDYLDDSEKGADGLTARQRARQDLNYDDVEMVYSGVRVTNRQLSEFGRDDKRRAGYAAKVPEQFVQDYVDYANIKRPANWGVASGQGDKGSDGQWYEDDWWMMEHPEYYQQVYLADLDGDGKPDHERKDYRKVPTREVFEKYLEYVQIKGDYWRDLYRKNNLDLDEWGQIAFGWKSIMKQQTKERPSAKDRFYENLRRGQEEFERVLRGGRL